MKKKIIYFFFISNMLLFSCQRDQSFIYDFTDGSWSYHSPVKFTFNIQDSVSAYNSYLFFRNNINYEYQNIYFLIETMHLGQRINLDTVEYVIADKFGRWKGRGIGQTKDNYFILNEDVVFNKGDYDIIIRHGMRKDLLIGANKLGFKITKND